MKTKYFSAILFLIAICVSSCDESISTLKKYYGSWEVSKYEYYVKNQTSGEFELKISHTTESDSCSSYFLLYNYEESVADMQNLCVYKMDTTISSFLVSNVGNTGACYWYVAKKGQITFWDAGTQELIVNITKSKSNKMEWSYTGDTFKEKYYLKRADV